MQINLKSHLNPEKIDLYAKKDTQTSNNLKQLKSIQQVVDISYTV